MKYLYITFLLMAPSLTFAQEDYAESLIGIWAMDPIKEIVPGAANVTEYKDDGSYSLTSYRCISDTEFVRTEENDSYGIWRMEGSDIITTPTDTEEIREIDEQLEAIKAMFENATEEEKQNFYKNAPPEMIAYIEAKPIEGRETIVSLSMTRMESKQEIMTGVSIDFISTKVSTPYPNCENFG